ncbi:MAG: DUF411 domain-containing protein [Deltaproteobacteria bacterium]
MNPPRVPQIILAALLVIAGVVSIAAADEPQKPQAKPLITVYKSPKCGCCSKWVEYMRKNGFEVVANNTSEMAQIKAKYGVPSGFGSCHTSLVDGYVVEGHVPVHVVERLLKERPKVAGITVPDMPMGSPGMEGEYNESYEVFTFDASGKREVYEIIKGVN